MPMLCICAYRGGGGLTDGQAWIECTSDSGETHSWDTWGNRDPIGLHQDLEKQYQVLGAYGPKVSCCVTVSNDQEAAFLHYIEIDEANQWGTLNNCAAFAARAWRAAGIGELSASNWMGIPNPNSLADAIDAACSASGGTLSGGGATPAESSTGTSSSAESPSH